MSYQSMAKSLASGEIPGVAISLARTKINEALGYIYSETDWSFQTQTGGWLNPGMVANQGTVTFTQFSNKVIGDAAASARWAAIVNPIITTLQIRNLPYSLYNIVAYDTTTNAPFGTLTLDRPWMEPIQGAGQAYIMYQAYFPVPVADFTKFVQIMDTTNNSPVDWWSLSQDDLAQIDSQRLLFGPTVPTYAVPFQTDQRSNSATLGNMLFEIWPHNLSVLPYTFQLKRKGPLLVNPTDAVVYPLSEELVTWRTKQVLYQYKEAQKGENMQRGSGADWRFLLEVASKEYGRCLKLIRALDANLHKDFVTHKYPASNQPTDGYSTNTLGQLNIGR